MRFSNAARGARRPRWLVLYFVLAAVCIATIGSSVAITDALRRNDAEAWSSPHTL